MSVPGPTLGPCASWTDGEAVRACTPSLPDGADADALAVEASMALYEISGRQFSGLCSRAVRPCRTACSCWGSASGLGPWYWTASAWGHGGGWGWRNESGQPCGCAPLSTVRLAGYPVREVVSVTIDGDDLPALDGNGAPNWRLDGWRNLVRMGDPGPPAQPRFWPSCQDLSLEPTEPGTFEVSYRFGVDPPPLGRDAAAELAGQLACAGTAACKLPTGATRVTREGVQVDRGLLANWFDSTKPTGLVKVDLFLRSYWAGRAGRRPAVWSPDVQPFARPAG